MIAFSKIAIALYSCINLEAQNVSLETRFVHLIKIHLLCISNALKIDVLDSKIQLHNIL